MVEKAYCKYGGDFSQRHLEGSKVNWAMKGGGVVQERKGREGAKSTWNPETKTTKRLHVQTGWFYRGQTGEREEEALPLGGRGLG